MRSLLLLLGLILTAIFFYYCLNNHAQHIQNDILTRVTAQTPNNISVNTSGRDVTLTGIVGTQAQKEQLGQQAADIYGVRTVQNNIEVILPKPVIKPEVQALKVEPKPVVIPCEKTLADILEKEKIMFDSGRSTIKQVSFSVLDQLVETTKQCQNAIVHIHGHTDSSGNEAKNRVLSLARADAVSAYFKENRVEQTITTHGHGSDQPLVSNDTKDGRAQNRRIEFKVETKK